jgi:hypothetical protein
MALSISSTLLTNGKSGGATSFTTTSIAPSSNKLILAVVFSDLSSGTGNEPTMSGNGLTWVKVVTQLNSSSSTQRITLFRAMGAPTAGAATIDFSGQTVTSVFWGIIEFSPVDLTGGNGAGAVVQSTSQSANSADPMSMTLSLSTFGNTANAAFAAIIGPDTPSTPSGFTSLFADTQDLGPDNSVRAVFKSSPATNIAFTSTGSGAGVATGLACEIKFATYGGAGVFPAVF